MGNSTVTLQDGEIAQRWAAALRRRYPGRNTPKLVAAAFDVSHRTAEAWLAGETAPYAKYLWRAWVLHGMAMVAEVLQPDSALAEPVDTRLADVADKLQQLGAELAQLRSERRRP